MARSRRRTPIIAHTTAASEKPDKQHANRNCRTALRSALKLDRLLAGSVRTACCPPCAT